MKVRMVSVVVLVCLVCISSVGFSQSATVDILRQGLLGAGTGAIAGSVSGGKSEKLWISALTGAGINIVGGTLLDMITEGNNTSASQSNARYVSPRVNRQYRRPQVQKQPVYVETWQVSPLTQSTYSKDFTEGYKEGYKDGYLLGYKEAVKELTGNI